jgi:hypothetical protein
LVDIDGDGHLDILSGSYSRLDGKMAGLFHVMYGNGDGTFRAPEVLKGADGKPLIVTPVKGPLEDTDNICTRPFAVDLDGDGKLDLVVGNFSGTFYWFKGLGKGAFDPKPERIMAGEEPLRIPGAHSDPFVIDWDGDGDLDILSGSSNGGVYWAENIAGKGKPPVFRQFKQLIPPTQPIAEGTFLRESDLKGPTHATRIWVDDFNADGKLDILVGDCVTLVSPAKGVSEAEFKKKYAGWKKEWETAAAALERAEAGNDEKEQTRWRGMVNRIAARRDEFMQEERTGFVWVYLRK